MMCVWGQVAGREGPKPLLCGAWGPGALTGGLTAPLSFASLPTCPGFDMTPNYVDASPTGIVVSPWCSCRGSGNMEEECAKFLRDFTENPCLRKSRGRRPPQGPSGPPELLFPPSSVRVARDLPQHGRC